MIGKIPYTGTIAECTDKIIIKVKDDLALKHATEIIDAREDERTKTVKACLAAVELADYAEAFTIEEVLNIVRQAIKGVNDEI